MEDTTEKEGLTAEHGLSLYVETKKHKIIVDTGASDPTKVISGFLQVIVLGKKPLLL